jgi:hypothetical protein
MDPCHFAAMVNTSEHVGPNSSVDSRDVAFNEPQQGSEGRSAGAPGTFDSDVPSSPKAAEDEQHEHDYDHDDENRPQHFDAPSTWGGTPIYSQSSLMRQS